MSDTIFTKIIAGEIPCHRVYDDAHLLAFLDINPLAEGHTLLIPKQHAATVDAMSEDSAAALGRALPRLCRAITRAVGCEGYNLLVNNGAAAGQEVMHVHWHIIPRFADRTDGSGLEKRWTPGSLTDGGALAARIVHEL